MTCLRLAVAALAVAAALSGCSGDEPDASGTPGARASQPTGTVAPAPGGTATAGGADAGAPLDPADFVITFSRLTVRGGSEEAVTQAVAEAEQLAGIPAPERHIHSEGGAFVIHYGAGVTSGRAVQVAGFVSQRFPATSSDVTGTGVAFAVTPKPDSTLGTGESALGALEALGLDGLTEKSGGRDGVWRYLYRGEALSAAQLNELRDGIAEAAGVPVGDVEIEGG